jgi:hypothetical protein
MNTDHDFWALYQEAMISFLLATDPYEQEIFHHNSCVYFRMWLKSAESEIHEQDEFRFLDAG